MYADVLVEYNSKSIDKTFTYLVPESLKDKLKMGMKVLVPFGKKLINGFVINIKDDYEKDYSIKAIDSIVDYNLILNKEMLDIGKYLKETTLSTLIAAYQTMLPSSLKVKEQKHKYDKYITYIRLIKEEKDVNNYISDHPNRKKQNEILRELLTKKQVLKNKIPLNIVKSLKEENLIEEFKENIYRLNYNCVTEDKAVELTNEQKNVINSISFNGYNTYLIHGVTGSGKTEVYIKLIKEVVKSSKTAILLVPEITLTAQIVSKFYKIFGNDVAIFHSALSDGEKYDEYLKILRREVHVVIGTRSAIFTPVNNLGIIIIDEEHSDTYKQENMPRYNAIDIAKYRAEYNNIPLILGSATPSLETMSRALKGVYKYLKMPNRVGASLLPNVKIIDMSIEMKKRNMILSDLLKQKIIDRLNKKEQIILLLNRRGFSTIITCSNCGYTYKCPNCDITLTYHKTSNNLRCHYCGYTINKEEKCPECHEASLNFYGLGTEKLELELSKQFPNSRIVRMDTDTTLKKGSHQAIIDKFNNHEYDILLGTQMISKGLDFPLVTLVGVINADATLNIPDFRSGERTFALLTQVAGRSGRSNLPGEVILQTFNPDNYILNCVKETDYMKFYNYEMTNRHKLNYPPYYYLCSIRITSKDYEIASSEINKVKKYLEKKINPNSIILGPTTASIFKINNIYRFQILIKYKKDENLNQTLKDLDEFYVLNNKANIEIDTSPIRV